MRAFAAVLLACIAVTAYGRTFKTEELLARGPGGGGSSSGGRSGPGGRGCPASLLECPKCERVGDVPFECNTAGECLFQITCEQIADGFVPVEESFCRLQSPIDIIVAAVGYAAGELEQYRAELDEFIENFQGEPTDDEIEEVENHIHEVAHEISRFLDHLPEIEACKGTVSSAKRNGPPGSSSNPCANKNVEDPIVFPRPSISATPPVIVKGECEYGPNNVLRPDWECVNANNVGDEPPPEHQNENPPSCDEVGKKAPRNCGSEDGKLPCIWVCDGSNWSKIPGALNLPACPAGNTGGVSSGGSSGNTGGVSSGGSSAESKREKKLLHMLRELFEE